MLKYLLILQILAKKMITGNIDNEGMHDDVNVIILSNRSDNENDTIRTKNKDSTADLKHFFNDAPHLPGNPKAQKLCDLCQ